MKKEERRRKFNFYNRVVHTIVFEGIYMYSGTELHLDSDSEGSIESLEVFVQ